MRGASDAAKQCNHTDSHGRVRNRFATRKGANRRRILPFKALFDPAKVKATAHGAPPDFSPGQVPKQAWQFPSWVGPEYNLSNTKWLQPPQLQEALRSYMGNIAFVWPQQPPSADPCPAC